ncbi:MAG: UDP-N-acetylmuramoyl-L-alanine--D-glutamate ligase [Spirochaetaceae bacterium]|jgi:UDP-N-acetylmuramoylalanine--D-glutamate ligase|nr:UDP-N-acetylmuramoyl-L-alanine--D-glutamate ligase [Spirochaetaceae bacterium]
MKVTIMGLGLNGGGLESARYLALRGADCTVTDLKDEQDLAPSIEKLESLTGVRPFRYVLGRHDMDDFKNADLVIKNPGVPSGSPYLSAARRVETDISLFLAASPARLIAVTGSKGKSSTASALCRVLAGMREKSLLRGKAFLGGNITVSPLSFLDELTRDDDVVLELSSWQLGDLRGRLRSEYDGGAQAGEALLKPRAAVLTSIIADHQDRYNGMESYVNDKRVVYQGQDKEDATIASADDSWGRSFLRESPGRPLAYSEHSAGTGPAGWIDPRTGAGMVRLADGTVGEAVPVILQVPGRHLKKNLLAAALALADLGIPLSHIRESLGTFPGIEHRLEFFREIRGIRFYNDTAATIPEAAAAAVEAFTGGETAGSGPADPLVLVTGGQDKNLDFSPLVTAAARAREIILLAGTGSDKLIPQLTAAGLSYHGPCTAIGDAAAAALEAARRHIGRAGRAVVVLSPGCASFGMFKNEFDRGRQWKEAVRNLPES